MGVRSGDRQLLQGVGLGSAVVENNDNIMSPGSTVRPQHYDTFMEALCTVTGMNDWRLKS